MMRAANPHTAAGSYGLAKPQGGTPAQASHLDFLEALFAGADIGQIILWRLSDKRALWTPLDRKDELARIGPAKDLYLAVALHDQALALRLAGGTNPAQVRGSIESAVAIPGLWADVDVHGPAHKRNDLPPTFADARGLIDAFTLPPAVVVHSGYGLQAWWLFKEPWVFEGPADRRRAQVLARRFGATLQAHAGERGWSIDDTSDLARLLRLPGTVNGKLAREVPVRIIEWRPDRRHEPSEFEPFLVASATDPVHRARPPEHWRELTAEGIGEGERNSTVASLAGHLLRRGIDPFVTLELLVCWNAVRCRPPLPEPEVARAVDSIAGRELRRRSHG